MKNFYRTICAIFAFVVALAMGACNNDPQLEGENTTSVTFNVEVVRPTPNGAEIAVTVQNVKMFAYVKRETDIKAVPILADGTKVTVEDPTVLSTKNITIQGLEPNSIYTYQFACRAADDTIIDNVVKVQFVTVDYGDNILTLVEQKYDGWSIYVQIPEEVKERKNALRYSTSSMAMYNYAKMQGSFELDMLLYNAAQYTTTDKLITYDEYHSTERDENGKLIYDENGNLSSATFADPKVPGEPGYFLIGEFGYMDDEEERVVYVDGEVKTVNDGSYMENSIWWYPAGWKAGFYMPQYDWKRWIEAIDTEDYDTEKYWNGYYERLYVETLQPEIIENGVEIKVSDKTPKDACISFKASDEVLQYCILVTTESEYETQILPVLEGKEEHLRWFTGSYFAMMSFGVMTEQAQESELWLSDWFVDTNGMAGQTIRVMVAGLGDGEGKRQSFDTITFQLPEVTLPKPEVVITPVPSDDPYSFTFNIKNPNGSSNKIEEAYFCCNYTREFDAILGEYSYTSLLKEMGNPLDTYAISAINSAAGFNMTMSSRDNATTRLALLVYNWEGSSNDPDAIESPAVAEYTTPNANWPVRVNSDLFDKLQGEWVATAPMRNYTGTDEQGNATYENAGTFTSPVTIMNGLPYSEDVPQEVYDIYTAAGISRDKTEELYEEFVEITKWYNNRTRGFNRLLCLGYNFADPSYLLDMVATPYDLFTASDYSVSQVSYMFYDFGPKWNLEIDADGSVWLPINVEREYPLETFNFGLDYALYMLAVGEYTYLGGDLVDNGKVILKARFPVEVAADYNTITIKPIVYTDNEGTTEYYYPCVAQLSMTGATPVNPRVKGDVVLKRASAATSAVAAQNAAVSNGAKQTLPSLGKAPVPMARPSHYTMTSLDPAKAKQISRIIPEKKIEAGAEAYHKRATAAVKAYFGF